MNKVNYFRIIAMIAFVALAAFSCFWTAESLFIWQPSITIYGAWMIAVVFYIVASICFSKFLKALDRNSDYYGKLFGRPGALLLSLVGLILFWLVVSLPTNTHTLLYRASVKNVVLADLNRTQGYLMGLKDNNVEIRKIKNKYETAKSAVVTKIENLKAEIDNPSAVGIGPRFEKILHELEIALTQASEIPVKITRAASVGSTRTQWLAAINHYEGQAYNQLGIIRAECDKKINEIKATMGSRELEGLIQNNKIALADLQNMNGVSNKVIAAAMEDLKRSYSYIKTNADYIEFKDNDKQRYTRDGAIPEAQEMLSVDKVWKDYLTTDKYAGHGFIWWVLIALLVDLSGFIFFNISFNSKSNNAIA